MIDVPEVILSNLVELAPRDIEELELQKYERRRVTARDLRSYQRDVMNSWLSARKGIIEMATGTGKTWVAIACMQAVDKDREAEKLFTIIAVPFKHLVPQWRDELARWRYDEVEEIHGEVPSWDKVLTSLGLNMRLGHIKRAIIITTHDTLTSPKFTDAMKENRFPILLIADEVHAVGSEIRKERLLENYTYRMGLSATPARHLDDVGTKALTDFFGGIIQPTVPLKKAIALGALVPYEYFPIVVELSRNEMDEYVRLTRKYAAARFSNDEEFRAVQDNFLFERARVVEAASAKYQALSNLFDEISPIDHCLIFVNERQIAAVNTILDSRRPPVVRHNLTEMERIPERTELISRFAEGSYQALVAIRCLDEGVDVPSARQAVIMASTGNPRQFIQRRGRVLRTDPSSGKEKAQVWDLVVAAQLKPNPNDEWFQLERSILERQLQRVEEFAADSLNPAFTALAITDIKVAYRI